MINQTLQKRLEMTTKEVDMSEREYCFYIDGVLLFIGSMADGTKLVEKRLLEGGSEVYICKLDVRLESGY